jgi:hypothetical protein
MSPGHINIDEWVKMQTEPIASRQAPTDHCLIDGCDGEYKSKGLCNTHYAQYRRYDLKTAISVADWMAIDKTPVYKLCLYKGCEERAKVKGLCTNHYYQHLKVNKKDPISVEDWVGIEKIIPERGICLVDGCGEFTIAGGLCGRHYKRFLRHKSTKQTRSIDWGERERNVLYIPWCNLIRCHKKMLCEDWTDFWKFVRDVGEKPEGECWFCPIDNKKTVGPGNFYWKMIDTTSSGAERREKLNAYAKAWRALNPEKAKELSLRKNYGIGVKEWDIMFKNQNGVCKICGKPETALNKKLGIAFSLSVDHCHETGEVRGLLCGACNMAIGGLMHDVDLMQKALDYCRTT